MAKRIHHRVTEKEWIVTGDELAFLWNVTNQRVLQFARLEGMPKVKPGRYNLKECLAWRHEKALEKSTRSKPLENSRMRETEARTIKHNLEIERLRESLIDLSVAKQAILTIASYAAEQMESISARVLVAPEIREKIKHETDRARQSTAQQVRNCVKDLADAGDSSADTGASTE